MTDTTLLRELGAIAGAEGCFDAADARAEKHRLIFNTLTNSVPEFSCVVQPPDLAALQACVRLLRRRNMALWWTCNAAGNGAVRSADPGPAVVLDLQRMNRILNVDSVSATALVEPGVSYSQLHDHLLAHAPGLWVDPDRCGANAITGSIMARHIGYTAYGDHLQMQCGMELVLADGNLVRTGMGALPGSDTWQIFKYNFGPYLDGLFTQSDFAIPSKVGLWLMPRPPMTRPFMVTLPNPAAFAQAVELLRPLKFSNVIPSTVVIAGRGLDEALRGRAAAPSPWTLSAALYGSPENVAETWRLIEPGFLEIPDSLVTGADDHPGDPLWQERRGLMSGIPTNRESDLGGYGGDYCAQLTVALPIDGAAAGGLNDLTHMVMGAQRREYLAEYVISGRVMFKKIYLPCSTSDPKAADATLTTARILIDALAGAGHHIVDESLAFKPLVDSHYRNSTLAGFTSKLRSALR